MLQPSFLTRLLILLFAVPHLLYADDPNLGSCPVNPMSMAADDDWKDACSIYSFVAEDIKGQTVSLSKYKGHVVLIVNVASQCGLTDTNYKQLSELHEKYSGNSPPLSILAFPCNQFGGQEPGTNREVELFSSSKYSVKFDMFSKVNVNGDDAHPLWKYLKYKQGGTLGDGIKWNFTKFLVNQEGQPVQRYSPTTDPASIEGDIVKLLGGAPRL